LAASWWDPAANLATWPGRLLMLAEGCFAALLVVAAYFMGGRHPLGELVFVTLIVMAAVAWLARQCLVNSAWVRSPGEYLILAGTVLVVLQLVPLPESLHHLLSPHTEGILPLWSAAADHGARLGLWSQVSLTPEATRSGLVMFLAYGLLYLIGVQRLAKLEDVERLLRWIAAATVLMATIGLVQYLSGTTRYVWIFENPERVPCYAVTASFFNKNHFAHFLALGLGPLLWWVQLAMSDRQSLRHRKAGSRGAASVSLSAGGRAAGSADGFARGRSRWESSSFGLLMVGLGIVLFAGLMSFSRGGIAAMAVAAAVALTLLLHGGVLGKRSALGLVAVMAIVGGSLFIHGYEQVADRLETAASVETLDKDRGRRQIWEADARAVADFLPLGSGVGSHREVYPMYIAEDSPEEYTHAECGPLQIAMETGLPGLALLVIGIGLCCGWCIGGLRRAGSPRIAAALAAVTAALAASVVHSVVDFVWYIPACLTLTVLLIASAFRLRMFARATVANLAAPSAAQEPVAESSVQLAPERERQPARRAARAMGWMSTGAVALLGLWMIGQGIGPALASSHLDRYFVLHEWSEDDWSRATDQGPEQMPDALARTALRCNEMIDELEQALSAAPQSPRAHLRLATTYLRRFELAQLTSTNRMGLLMIQDAVNHSHFRSRQELDAWAARGIGPSRQFLDLALWHVRRALALCPLQGDGYAYLAQLCFLEGAGPKARAAYIEQALRVRPLDGDVLFAAGQDAAMRGDVSKAVDCWKQSFHHDRASQQRLIDVLPTIYLGPNLSGPDFVVSQFQPDLIAMRLLHDRYVALKNPQYLERFDQYYVRQAEAEVRGMEEDDAARVWLEIAQLYRELRQPQPACSAARQAVAITPNDYQAQFTLGCCLYDAGQLVEAQKQLNWCLQRKPDNDEVKQLVEQVVRDRMDQESRVRSAQSINSYQASRQQDAGRQQ